MPQRTKKEEKAQLPLTGYFHASEMDQPISDTHGHYLGPEETAPVIHTHKGGRRVHFHEGADD